MRSDSAENGNDYTMSSDIDKDDGIRTDYSMRFASAVYWAMPNFKSYVCIWKLKEYNLLTLK